MHGLICSTTCSHSYSCWSLCEVFGSFSQLAIGLQLASMFLSGIFSSVLVSVSVIVYTKPFGYYNYCRLLTILTVPSDKLFKVALCMLLTIECSGQNVSACMCVCVCVGVCVCVRVCVRAKR
jgi:hypothetical protein